MVTDFLSWPFFEPRHRAINWFGGPPPDEKRSLDDTCRALVRSLGEEGLAQPCGPVEGKWAEYTMAELVLHINREVIHHGAEIALLRDLYAHRR